MTHASLPVAVHIFLIKDNKILLIKRANTGFQDGKWAVPGGRLEVGERIKQATIREVLEEVGVVVDEENLPGPLVMNHHDERGERIHFCFLVNNFEGEAKNCEPDKCSEVGWFDLDNLPDNLADRLEYVLDKLLKKETYCEFGF